MDCRIHSGKRGFTRAGSFGFAWVQSGAIWVVGFIRVLFSPEGFGVVGFAWIRSSAPRDRRVLLGSRWFTTAHLGVVGFRWVHSVGPSGRPVQSSSRGFTQARPGVVAFTWVRLGFLPSGRLVHSGAPRGRRVD